MSIPVAEAAQTFGVSVATVRSWQKKGWLPDPIPDDHLDSVINFRIQLEQVFREKVDRRRSEETADAE